MERLQEHLAANDWGAAQGRARELGPAGAAATEPFLEDPEVERRLLVAEVLNITGGEESWAPLLQLSGDPDQQVHVRACQILLQNPPRGRVVELLRRWRSAPCTRTRAELTKVLGMISGRHDHQLRERLEELDRERDASLVALGRLGDPRARARFGRLMAEARGERLLELAELLPVVDQAWILPYLLPWLERDEVVQIIPTHVNTYIRLGRDLACEEALRCGDDDLELEPHLEPYSEAERAEIEAYLRSRIEGAPPALDD